MSFAVTAFVLLLGLVPAPSLAQGAARRPDTTFVRLNDLVRAALSQNLELRSAEAEARATQSNATAVRSRFDPVLNLGSESGSSGIGGQLTGGLPTGAGYLLGSVSPSRLPGEPLYPNAVVASISQPVLRGLGFHSSRNAIRAVDEGIAASQARLSRVRDQVATSIAIAYAVLVERNRQEAIAANSVRRAEDLLAAYTELHRLELITDVDLTTAQLGVTSRRAALLAFQRDREAAQDDLLFGVYGARAASVLTGDDTVVMPTDSTLAIPALGSLAEATRQALVKRPDVEAARREAARTRYQSAYARNASLPTLNVTAAFTSTLVDSASRAVYGSASGDTRKGLWSLGLEFSRPLRNSAASAEVERTSAADVQAGLAVTDAENVARAEVRAAFRDIALGQQHAELARQASTLAQRQYDGERARLDLGLTDIFRVLQFEEQRSQVEHAEASAWLALATSIAQYKAAVGVAAAEYSR